MPRCAPTADERPTRRFAGLERGSASSPFRDGTVDRVDRYCARPTCNEPAVAAFNFDGLRRIVWLNAITEARTNTRGTCATGTPIG